MAPREDLNLPVGDQQGPEPDTQLPEGTDTEVPEPAMAAVSESPPKVATPAPPTPEPASGKAEEGNRLREEPTTDNPRNSTFLTEVEDTTEEVDSQEVANIVQNIVKEDTTSLALGAKVEELGTIEDVSAPAQSKETSPAPTKETSPAPTKEASPAPIKEASPAPAKEASPAPAKETSPEPIKEASPAPTKEASPAPVKETSPEPMKETSPAPAKDVEPIGAVEELKAEVNALLSAGKVEDAKVIDISLISEPKESSVGPEEKIEEVLEKIPDDKKIIDDAKEIIESIEKSTEDGAVIDIRVVEETKEEQDVVDIVKAAKEAFVAEVIPDNADIDVVPDEGEEVIEYTLNAADAIPIGAIAVATFAIFLALIFYYN